MDPAGLLISIATIALTIDQITETYASSSKTLALIRSQIRILETGTQRIQEWLHFTDPTSKVQVSHSLQDSIATVNSSIESLHEDLDHITTSGPKASKVLGRAGSDQWTKAKFALNESRLRKHLTDVRECASLIHFTLTVCQLPVGKTAEQEVRELEIGAKTLSRAHKSTRQARWSVLTTREIENEEGHSEDFNAFIKSVRDAEKDLPDDYPIEKAVMRQGASLPSTDAGAEVEPTLDEGAFFKAQTPTKERLFIQESPAENSPSSPQFSIAKSAPAPQHDELFLPNQNGESAGSAHRVQSPPAPVAMRTSSMADQEGLIPVQRHEHFALNGSQVSQTMSVRPLNIHKRQTSSSYFPPASSTPPLPPKVFAEEPGQIGQAMSTPPVRKPVTRKPLRGSSISGEVASVTPQTRRPTTPRDESFAPGTIGMASPMPEKASWHEEEEVIAGPSASGFSFGLASQNSGKQNVMVEPLDDPPPYQHRPIATPPLGGFKRPQSQLKSLSVEDESPRLISVVRQGRADEVKNLLRSGVDIDEVQPDTQRTALMEAAHFGQATICALLSKAGARLHLKDSDGCTALHLAASRGDAQICQIIIDAGAELEFANTRGQTPLEMAAQSGNSVHTIVFLLSRTPKCKTNDPLLLKAFFEAVKAGNVGIAQAFLANDVKPKKIKESWKPAGYAAQSGNTQMLDFVICQKCSLKDRSPDGWTPLHFAARNGHLAMVERLLEKKVPWKSETKKRKETALHLALTAGHTSTALALIQHKDASVSIKDADNQEPMHHAVRNGDSMVVSVLISKGAKPRNANGYGWQPMHLAAAYGHASLVAEFMTSGTSIEDRLAPPAFKPAKRTNEAAKKGYLAEARWPHIGVRPLHLALEFSQDHVAKMLISAGAKVDEADSRGWRPLHHAAFSCRAEMVDLLLAKGASPHATTVDGNTPLALGSREYGLSARSEDTWRVRELLGSAMESQKRSKFKQLTGLMSSGGGNMTAKERNKAWHNAEVAISLAQAPIDDDDQEDGESRQTSEADFGDFNGSISSQSRATSELDSISSQARARSTSMIEGPDSFNRLRAMS